MFFVMLTVVMNGIIVREINQKQEMYRDMSQPQQQQRPQYTEEQLKELIKQQQDPRHNQE